MKNGRCQFCRHWFDDTAERQAPEMLGECLHPDIKELAGLYLITPTLKMIIDPKPFAPSGEFGCVLWEPLVGMQRDEGTAVVLDWPGARA